MVTIDIEIGVIQSAFKRCRGMMGDSGWGGPKTELSGGRVTACEAPGVRSHSLQLRV